MAFAIMGMALGLLYRAAGGSVRSVGDAQHHSHAVALAESLMASYDAVPEGGLAERGESAGMSWQIRSQPFVTNIKGPNVPLLHELSVQVSWGGNDKPRQFELVTVLPQQGPIAGVLQR